MHAWRGVVQPPHAEAATASAHPTIKRVHTHLLGVELAHDHLCKVLIADGEGEVGFVAWWALGHTASALAQVKGPRVSIYHKHDETLHKCAHTDVQAAHEHRVD